MRRVRIPHSDGHCFLLGSQEQNPCCRRAILESGSAEGGSGSTGWCGVWVGGRGEWVNRLVRSRLLTNVGELQASLPTWLSYQPSGLRWLAGQRNTDDHLHQIPIIKRKHLF